MRRAVILDRSILDLLPHASAPANDNDPPEPPPAASRRAPRLPPLLTIMSALGTRRAATAAQAA